MSGQNIQWFPGHMAKTRRLIGESLKLVDAAAEIIDARIPVSSRNPELAGIVAHMPKLILLNKCDMADESVTKAWLEALSKEDTAVLPVDCRSGRGLNRFLPETRRLLASRLARYREKGMAGRSLRVMVVGIPNVGKSSFINRMAGTGKAKVANRPGVTRGNQWFTIGQGVELLDTPGVLWPKFDDSVVGERLAFTGAIKDTVVDIEALACDLLDVLKASYFVLLQNRYRLNDGDCELPSYALLEKIGMCRGMRIAGGEVDTERAAAMVLEEFRNCKIGRISLERP